MKDNLIIKVIFWQDVSHRNNISLNFCGLIYDLARDVSSSFVLTGENLYNAITNILFFYIKNEHLCVTEDKFNPHQIMNEEKINAMYYCNELNDQLKYISVN